jgi:hypothetical protein
MTNHAAQLVIVLWFGRNSARPAPALTPVSLVFAVFNETFYGGSCGFRSVSLI